MWYLYRDESGDLGFDFVNKKPSGFFTLCILATSHRESFIKISQAVDLFAWGIFRKYERKNQKWYKDGTMYLKIGYCTMTSIYKKERATRGRLFQGFCQPMDGNTLDTQEGLTALQEFYTLILFCQENKLVKLV